MPSENGLGFNWHRTVGLARRDPGTSRYHYSGIEKGLDHLSNDHGVSTVFKDARQTLKVLNIQHSVLFSAFKTGLKTEDENL
jgi:hypothetical protein